MPNRHNPQSQRPDIYALVYTWVCQQITTQINGIHMNILSVMRIEQSKPRWIRAFIITWNFEIGKERAEAFIAQWPWKASSHILLAIMEGDWKVLITAPFLADIKKPLIEIWTLINPRCLYFWGECLLVTHLFRVGNRQLPVALIKLTQKWKLLDCVHSFRKRF